MYVILGVSNSPITDTITGLVSRLLIKRRMLFTSGSVRVKTGVLAGFEALTSPSKPTSLEVLKKPKSW
jgi:hypothetical protein